MRSPGKGLGSRRESRRRVFDGAATPVFARLSFRSEVPESTVQTLRRPTRRRRRRTWSESACTVYAFGGRLGSAMTTGDNIGVNNTSAAFTLGKSNDWQEVCLAGALCVVIVITLLGNTLIIMAVLTTRRLRTVTNCFVMSLAVADWMVAMFVMPPAVALHLVGEWKLGRTLCNIWVSMDVLLCTASILSLCAISIDRYLAVTRPLGYSRRRRSKRLAFTMIVFVWMVALAITCPPILGWYEPDTLKDNECRYNRNRGYVIFSALGSFFLPMVVMVYVYVRISCVVAQRHNQLAGIEPQHSVLRKSRSKVVVPRDLESDMERGSSECDEIRCVGVSRSLRTAAGCPPPTPPRSASMYAVPTTPNANNSRLEPLYVYEPATRISSFRRETKTAQTLSIVVGGFIACWLPFFVYYLLMPFLPPSMVDITVFKYFTWLGWINSAINPFIYAFYSPDFRIAFWRLTVRHCFKKRHAAVQQQQHK